MVRDWAIFGSDLLLYLLGAVELRELLFTTAPPGAIVVSIEFGLWPFHTTWHEAKMFLRHPVDGILNACLDLIRRAVAQREMLRIEHALRRLAGTVFWNVLHPVKDLLLCPPDCICETIT